MEETYEFLKLIPNATKAIWNNPELDRWNYLAALIVWSATCNYNYVYKNRKPKSYKLSVCNNEIVTVLSEWLNTPSEGIPILLGSEDIVEELDNPNARPYDKLIKVSSRLASAIRSKAEIDPLAIVPLIDNLKRHSGLLYTMLDTHENIFVAIQ